MAKPLVPWMGGKSRLAKHILPLFPKHTCYVEPFAGAAALFFFKEQSKVEVLNDINGELINLYRVIQHHLEEFIKQFEWAISSRQAYEWEKLKDTRTLTDIQRAARFYYLQKLAFGGKVHSQAYGIATTTPSRLNLLNMQQDLSDAHLRLARTNVENLTWQECISKYDRPDTLFYNDPPYWKTEGYGEKFGLDNYIQMAELARSIEGKMVISVNDIPEMNRAFKGLRKKRVGITYTVGGTQRRTQRQELILRNW